MTRARRPWWFIGLGVLAVSLLVGLGVWQLQRLQWKTALIERVEAGLVAPPSAVLDPIFGRASHSTRRNIGVSKCVGSIFPVTIHS